MNEWKDSVVIFQASDGLETEARLVRLSRLAAVFESSSPDAVVRISEVFKQFQIRMRDRTLYSGRAVVRNLLNTGATTLCEVTLSENAWTDLMLSARELRNGTLGAQFAEFMGEWQKLYRLDPEYKVIVADMHTFLTDLRLWLEQLQLNLRGLMEEDLAALETETAENLAASVLPCIDILFEKFERIAGKLDADHLPAHRNYMRRQLHSLVLCAPFAYRTFVKPLGYAGDYEMVNMITRNRPEGDSLYAKILNAWFVRQPPAQAHRNRLSYLTDKLLTETLRASRQGRPARICNLACGPAQEVQDFIQTNALADRARFMLLDFNEETLQYLQTRMGQIKRSTGRRTTVAYTKKSVHRLLKEAEKSAASQPDEPYDYIYCAGLFDYLSDQVCHRLLNILYDWLAPGGLLLTTNVEPCNPLRHGMEHLLDWNLIYRDAARMLDLKPRLAPPEDCRVQSDATGVNVFLEISKPAYG